MDVSTALGAIFGLPFRTARPPSLAQACSAGPSEGGGASCKKNKHEVAPSTSYECRETLVSSPLTTICPKKLLGCPLFCPSSSTVPWGGPRFPSIHVHFGVSADPQPNACHRYPSSSSYSPQYINCKHLDTLPSAWHVLMLRMLRHHQPNIGKPIWQQHSIDQRNLAAPRRPTPTRPPAGLTRSTIR